MGDCGKPPKLLLCAGKRAQPRRLRRVPGLASENKELERCTRIGVSLASCEFASERLRFPRQSTIFSTESGLESGPRPAPPDNLSYGFCNPLKSNGKKFAPAAGFVLLGAPNIPDLNAGSEQVPEQQAWEHPHPLTGVAPGRRT